MIKVRIAVVVATIEADAHLILVAKATTEINVTPYLLAKSVIGTDPVQVFVSGTFGNDIDHTTNTTIRCHPSQKRSGAFKNFDTLGITSLRTICWCNTVNPIEGNFARVTGIHVETTDLIGIKHPATTVWRPNGWIML